MNFLYAFIDTLAQLFKTTLFTYYFIAIYCAFDVVMVRFFLDTFLIKEDEDVSN